MHTMGRIKRHFHFSHVTKVSAETFARGCKKHIWLRKTFLYNFLLLLTDNILHLF